MQEEWNDKGTGRTAFITAGMKVTGDIEVQGPLLLEGSVEGSISCKGTLTVRGVMSGSCEAEELILEGARMEGNAVSSGDASVGKGTVLIGDLASKSATVSGAVKGNIDVDGHVSVEPSAVVVGDIRSKSVQVSNGAVIDGMCSQSYAQVDVKAVFGG